MAVQPDAEQTVAEDLGSDQGTFGLIAAGVMIVCVAPFAEEFFFRGFFYRALRSRFVPLGARRDRRACSGSSTSTSPASDALLILPPLALLGFIFCLVYEKTGSLYPCIAMHAINNSIAYGAQADGWAGLGRARPADDRRVHRCCRGILPERPASVAAPDCGCMAPAAPARVPRSMMRPARLALSIAASRLPPARRGRHPTPPTPPHRPRPRARPWPDASFGVSGGLATKQARYFARGQTVVRRAAA